jgi:Na+-driven multidrug efflux pump
LGAYVNLGSFYLIGIPTALFLGFVLKMEAKGLWMGISCGSIVQFLLLAVITFFSNRQKMVCAFYKPMQVFSFPLINTGHRKKNDL